MIRAAVPSVWGKTDECGLQSLRPKIDRAVDQKVLRGHTDSLPRALPRCLRPPLWKTMSRTIRLVNPGKSTSSKALGHQ